MFVVVTVMWIPCAVLDAAPSDESKPQHTLRPSVTTRPVIPVAQYPTLEVEEFSGDFAHWTDHMTLNERRKLSFRWKNIRGPITNPRWQITTSENVPLIESKSHDTGTFPSSETAPNLRGPTVSHIRGGYIGEGRVSPVPAKGSYTGFDIDFTQILPETPPATARKYYVRIVISEKSHPDYVDSRSVVITYQRPSQQTTQFTEEGLQTTPQKIVAPPGDRRYDYPKIAGLPLDWCKFWGTQCGQPAADEFCQREGYRRAKSFSKSSATTMGVCEKGSCKTRVITTYQVCDNPSCRALALIICTHDRDCVSKYQKLNTMYKSCGWDESLVVAGKKGNVNLPWVPKQTNSIYIPVTPKFNWYCGNKKETASCPNDTAEVNISRWTNDYVGQKNVKIECEKVIQECKN